MSRVNKGAEQGQKKEQPKKEQAAPATTATTVQPPPVVPAHTSSWWSPAGVFLVGMIMLMVAFIYFHIDWTRREKKLKAQIDEEKKKYNELKGKFDKLLPIAKQLQADYENLFEQHGKAVAELKSVSAQLVETKQKLDEAGAERDNKSQEICALLEESLEKSKEIDFLTDRAEQAERQYAWHAEELSAAYERFKGDLDAARSDEREQIRQNGELLLKGIREEYALKEREQRKELTEMRVELDEMTKLVKEKNPTMYTAIQKDLRSRVQARLNADQRKEAKKEEKQLAADERKLIAPAD